MQQVECRISSISNLVKNEFLMNPGSDSRSLLAASSPRRTNLYKVQSIYTVITGQSFPNPRLECGFGDLGNLKLLIFEIRVYVGRRTSIKKIRTFRKYPDVQKISGCSKSIQTFKKYPDIPKYLDVPKVSGLPKIVSILK